MILDLDSNATCTPSEGLQRVISAAWHRLGNPSSIHRQGQRARAAIEGAREVIRKLVGAGSRDAIIFTSGATEANNLILVQGNRSPAGAFLSSHIEHPCILQPLAALGAEGREVILVSPNSAGEITPEAVTGALTANIQLITIMAANNETGVINDTTRIALTARATAPKALLHSDYAQVVGKLPVSFSASGLDAITISGHKFGSLSGVGALIVKEGVSIVPAIRGGPQEGKLRGGTENVLGIISLAAAAEEVIETIDSRLTTMRSARDRFELLLKEQISDIEINGASAARLPNTSSVTIPGIRADDLVVASDLQGMLLSSGAACSSGKPEPSHVLMAMGLSEERARSTIRVSFRADHTSETADRAVTLLAQNISRMRQIS